MGLRLGLYGPIPLTAVFLVQDERTLGGRAETALWTNSEDYVKAHVEIFEQGWTSGVPAETRIEALQQT